MPSSDLPANLAVVPAGTPRPDRGGDARPILVIDSGLGGLTVVKELRRALPAERLVYFGDTARLPYGSKTPETVTGFVRQIVRHCRPFDPKHVVLACNTASALALNRLRREMPDLPVTGVIDPGARAAVRAAGSRPRPTIGVIGTEATVRSKAYDHAVHRRRQHARLMVRATPLLAAMVEEGRRADDPLVALALQQYLAPMLEKRLHVLLAGLHALPDDRVGGAAGGRAARGGDRLRRVLRRRRRPPFGGGWTLGVERGGGRAAVPGDGQHAAVCEAGVDVSGDAGGGAGAGGGGRVVRRGAGGAAACHRLKAGAFGFQYGLICIEGSDEDEVIATPSGARLDVRDGRRGGVDGGGGAPRHRRAIRRRGC